VQRPGASESTLTRRGMDLAASIQEVTEEAVMKLAGFCVRGETP
jgi:predicted NodU family carbamoyl transferase